MKKLIVAYAITVIVLSSVIIYQYEMLSRWKEFGEQFTEFVETMRDGIDAFR